MAFILYTASNSEHRALTVSWCCLNVECRHVFTASLKNTKGDWAWCPKCNASSRMLCEAVVNA